MLVPVLLFDDEISRQFGGEEGLRRLQSYGPWAWLAGISLIVCDLVLPVPSTAIIAGLGMIYGPIPGGVLGGIGSALAGLIAYGGCRLLGDRVFKVFVGETNIEKLRHFFENHALWAIAFSRWMPLLPEALCCLAGMARMPLVPFLTALGCGSLVMGFAFSFLGKAYLDRPVVGFVVSALIPLFIWPFLHMWLQRPKAESALNTSQN